MKYLFFFLFLTVSTYSFAQQDSTETSSETVIKKEKKEKKSFTFGPNHSPKKATIFSAVLPGLGQAYNKSYWKIPIIWGGGAALGYFIGSHNKNYKLYQKEYTHRVNGNTSQYNPDFFALTDATVKSRKDFYRRNRDLSIVMAFALYALNIMDANVDAHLKEFRIDEKTLMSFEPSVSPDGQLGMSLSFNF